MQALRDVPVSSSSSSTMSNTMLKQQRPMLAPQTHRFRRLQVVCMAHPRRIAKVASQIQREVSEMFIYDKVVQEAICPERRRGLDDQLSAVASITEVYVSGDLQVAKVYVSVYSDEAGKEQAINNLRRVAPYVRSRIGQAMGLRLTPEIRFIQDNSLDELEQLQDAIGRDEFARLAAEAEAEAGGTPAASSSSSSASRQSSAAGSSAEAAAGFAGEDLNDDSGFFDLPDSDSTAAAAAGGDGEQQQQQQLPAVEWSRQDPNSFFAVDEEEVVEAESVWYSRRGPFDDLFGDAGEDMVQQRQQQQSRSGGGRGKGKAGRKAAQKQ